MSIIFQPPEYMAYPGTTRKYMLHSLKPRWHEKTIDEELFAKDSYLLICLRADQLRRYIPNPATYLRRIRN